MDAAAFRGCHPNPAPSTGLDTPPGKAQQPPFLPAAHPSLPAALPARKGQALAPRPSPPAAARGGHPAALHPGLRFWRSLL